MINSGVTGGGGRVPPGIFHREVFADLPGKKGQGRNGKWRGKEGKFERKRCKIENGREKVEK